MVLFSLDASRSFLEARCDPPRKGWVYSALRFDTRCMARGGLGIPERLARLHAKSTTQFSSASEKRPAKDHTGAGNNSTNWYVRCKRIMSQQWYATLQHIYVQIPAQPSGQDLWFNASLRAGMQSRQPAPPPKVDSESRPSPFSRFSALDCTWFASMHFDSTMASPAYITLTSATSWTWAVGRVPGCLL